MPVPATPTGISPDPQKTTSPDNPSRSTKRAVHQHAPPRSRRHHRRLTVAEIARPAGPRGGSWEREWQYVQHPREREQPPPPMAITDRTKQPEQTRPLLPDRAQSGLVKLESSRCSRCVAVAATQALASPWSAEDSAGRPRPSPPRPRWGPNGPRSGPGGLRRRPSRCFVARPQPRHLATRKLAGAVLAEPHHRLHARP